MARQRQTDERTDAHAGVGTAIRRRGLVAGAAALVAGIVATQTATPVTADTVDTRFHATGMTGIAYDTRSGSFEYGVYAGGTNTGVVGYGNSFQGGVLIGGIGVKGTGGGTDPGVYAVGGNNAGHGVVATGTNGGFGVLADGGGAGATGVVGRGSGAGGTGVRGLGGSGGDADGVQGYGSGAFSGTAGGGGATSGTGAYGQGGTPNGIGVRGVGTGSGTAVLGIANDGIGVNGQSTTGPGVRGTSGNTGSEDGVRGLAYGTGRGVSGFAGSGSGVFGTATTGIGVYGISGGGSASGAQPYGVVGSVTSAPGFALFGVTSVAGTVGFAGGAAVAGASAGQFSGAVNIYNSVPGAEGNLYVQNNFQVSGVKSAAVPHPDGTHRLLYCVESPEAWFEDFGEGTLVGGKAEVTLDPDLAAVVDTAKLHVFLTPHGDGHHLNLAGRSATGFSVGAEPSATGMARGIKATDVSGTFSYRVVAKRKDVAAPRLAKFDLPREIKVPALVIPPTLPPPAKKG